MYKICTNGLNQSEILFCQTRELCIPLQTANRHYQEFLDTLIEQGSDCFEGDIPADLQAAADAKVFAQQALDYKKAKSRLAKYQLSVGVSEVRETVPTGEQTVNDDTGEITDVMEEIVTTKGIAPLPATVEIKTYVEDTPSVEAVDNPLIVSDNAERAEAQAVVDNTPQPVKDHVDGN